MERGVRSVDREAERGPRIVWRVETEKDEQIQRRLADAIVNSGWGLFGMQALGLSLEEIFLKVTSDEEAAESPAEEPELSEESPEEQEGDEA